MKSKKPSKHMPPVGTLLVCHEKRFFGPYIVASYKNDKAIVLGSSGRLEEWYAKFLLRDEILCRSD